MMIIEKTRVSFDTDQEQQVWSTWHNKFLFIKYCGQCEACGIRTYLFTNSDNDPRGPLGEHTNNDMEASEYNSTGPDVIACFSCTNDRKQYEKLLAISKTKWTRVNES